MSQSQNLITESKLAEIRDSISLFSLNGCCLYYSLVTQQALIFWSSFPVPLLFTGRNRVNSLVKHQFYTIHIESGNSELPKGSKTLGLSG